MKEEALKLADELEDSYCEGKKLDKVADMIRKLVAEIDTYRLKNSNQIDIYRYKFVA